MKVRVISESGHLEALLGLGLSHGVSSGFIALGEEKTQQMMSVADRLAHIGHGHNKFLRQIVVWLDITAPRYWWAEFDTYKVGTVAQSESTMHTILKTGLSDANFEHPVSDTYLDRLNELVKEKDLVRLKAALPEGFLQRRIVSLNYATLQEIFNQRKGHRLPEWRVFIDEVRNSVINPHWIEIGHPNFSRGMCRCGHHDNDHFFISGTDDERCNHCRCYGFVSEKSDGNS